MLRGNVTALYYPEPVEGFFRKAPRALVNPTKGNLIQKELRIYKWTYSRLKIFFDLQIKQNDD